MKSIYIILTLLFSLPATVYSQPRKPKTYALVIGVSHYKDPNITSLNYAHLDADAFSRFCISPLGLNIPKSQIKLLTNEDASFVNILDELDWIKTEVKKNDIAYIYFAGHGAIESPKLGKVTLLAHDSKYVNQYHRAISLRLLDETVETISLDTEAKVFLITDACHSGKLADAAFTNDNHLNAQLSKVQTNNEVRITSCKEFELSFEDKAWGNGRGAFSYFLVKGMAGEADGMVNSVKDNQISIGEINAYLLKNVPQEVETIKQKKQNPVIKGSESIVFNQFKPGAIQEVIDIKTSDTIGIVKYSGSRGAIINPSTRNFAKKIVDELLDNENTDVKSLSAKSPKEIRKKLLKEYVKINAFHNRKLSVDEGYKLIAKVMYEKYLNHIDPYVCGNVEKTNNSLYASVDTYLDELPYVIEIANKLLPKEHYLVKAFSMQKEYLSGLSKRLKIFSVTQTELIEEAFAFQNKALALAPEAAFVHNELGLLHLLKEENDKAKYYFEKAIEIAPLWFIPQNNLKSIE